MQYFIYPVLIVFLAIIIYGAITRKSVYKEVDRLEAWKIKIMNKPVTDEIAKIKGLNMSGETEQKFESWREAWDEILTLKLPDIEEKLFDIEEAANKYRFVKAKQMLKSLVDELTKIEESIQKMLADVHLLINSEESNREQIDDVRNLFKETKKHLSKNKTILGTTVFAFDNKLNQIEQSFQAFDVATKDGNYFEAREILLMMNENLEQIKKKMDDVPKTLVLIETDIPAQLDEIALGINEMEEEGYILDHYPIKSDLQELKKSVNKLLSIVEKGDLDAAEESIAHIYNEIDRIYDLLEQEVLAKQFVSYEIVTIREETDRLREGFFNLKADVDMTKLSYRIPEEEIKTHLKLDKQIKELQNKLIVIDDILSNQKQSYITIKTAIEEYKIELKKRVEVLEKSIETLNCLRSDEIKAHDTLRDLKEKVRQGQRLIKKSNIPGLPESILVRLNEAEECLVTAHENLATIPLVMVDVNHSMEQALETVNDVYELITETIEKALTAERVIQYGNRFRSDNTFIHVELLRAEEAFRQFQYEESLEIALLAIEDLEPKVLEKITIYSQKV